MSKDVQSSAVFWIVAILALLWYLMGCAAYIYGHSVTPETLIPIYGQEGSDIVMGRPVWQVAGWALAVFGGLIGTFGLLLRKSWSRIMYVIALIGAIIYDVWVFTSGYFQHSLGFDKFIFVMSVLAPVLLIFFCTKMISKGVLR